MILLVEDNADDAEVMRMALERSWIAEPVTWVRSGEEALSYCKGEGRYADRRAFPLPRLVLVDLSLATLSGWDVLTWLRREAPFKAVPVVVVTGSNVREDVDTAYRMGANSFVSKQPDMGMFMGDMRQVARYWLGVSALPRAEGARGEV
jgi:CheY-like chemotaxis protein